MRFPLNDITVGHVHACLPARAFVLSSHGFSRRHPAHLQEQGSHFMLTFPDFNPYIFKLGPIHPTWYGLMYVIGFGCAYLLGVQRTKSNPAWNKEEVSDLMTYLMLGVVLGGRIGYVLFYGMGYWAQDLLYPFKIWEGGMSFHGGLLGVMFALWLFGRKKGKRFWDVTDYVAPMIPPGLFFGRIGNFINGELWGRPTDVPWGMVFPGTHDGIPRHPSQLYEAGLEGIALFVIIWFYSARSRRSGQVSGMFLVLYGVFRSLVEMVRQPDGHIDFIIGRITMGQALSLPMIVFGLWLLFRRGPRANLS